MVVQIELPAFSVKTVMLHAVDVNFFVLHQWKVHVGTSQLACLRRSLASYVQKHLKSCSMCQGRGSPTADVLASYAVTEHDDTRILLPKKQNREAPLGQQQGASKKSVGVRHLQRLDLLLLSGTNWFKSAPPQAMLASSDFL